MTVGTPTGRVTSPVVLPPRPSVTVTVRVQADMLGWPESMNDGAAVALLNVPAHELVQAYVSKSPSPSVAEAASAVGWPSTTQAGVAVTWFTVGHWLNWTVTAAWPRPLAVATRTVTEVVAEAPWLSITLMTSG